MDDLISRRAAIELVDWYQHEFNECDYAFGELANELSKLPSAQRWIPVTERLPESGQSVLIAENDTDPDWYAAIGQYKYGKWEWRDDMHTALPPKVVAWMPLPEPWEGGAE